MSRSRGRAPNPTPDEILVALRCSKTPMPRQRSVSCLVRGVDGATIGRAGDTDPDRQDTPDRDRRRPQPSRQTATAGIGRRFRWPSRALTRCLACIMHGTTYAGPDGATARAAGTCRTWPATRARIRAALRYDSTGPDVRTGKPARKPDRRGWYTRPVRWRFTGSDGLSGLAECPEVRYAGPDGAAARVIGGCADRAGNVEFRGFPIRYDDTAPPPPDVRALPRDRAVRLNIRVVSDVRRIRVVRTPGRGSDAEQHDLPWPSEEPQGPPCAQLHAIPVHRRRNRPRRPPVAQGVRLCVLEAGTACAAQRGSAHISPAAALVDDTGRGLLQRAARARRQEGAVRVAHTGAAAAQAALALRRSGAAYEACDLRVERVARVRTAQGGKVWPTDRQADVRHPWSTPSAVRSSTGSSNEHEP